jgi:hypothetical protein
MKTVIDLGKLGLKSAVDLKGLSFAQQKGLTLTAKGSNPLTATIVVTQNLIHDREVFLGFLLGTLSADKTKFNAAAFYGGADLYGYGCLVWGTPAAPELQLALKTYALNIAKSMSFDALVWICPKAEINMMAYDYGAGPRVVGYLYNTWLTFIPTFLALQAFSSVLTINP